MGLACSCLCPVRFIARPGARSKELVRSRFKDAYTRWGPRFITVLVRMVLIMPLDRGLYPMWPFCIPLHLPPAKDGLHMPG